MHFRVLFGKIKQTTPSHATTQKRNGTNAYNRTAIIKTKQTTAYMLFGKFVPKLCRRSSTGPIFDVSVDIRVGSDVAKQNAEGFNAKS